MSIRRVLLCCSLVLPAACADKKGAKSVSLEDAPTSSAPTIASGSTIPTRRVHLRASLEGLEDMLTWVEDVAHRSDPGKPIDLRAEMQADLLQAGFGPGFYASMDLAGMFALELGWPFPEVAQPPPRGQDWEIAGIIPALDTRRLLDSMPDTNKPQPLSDGLWELIDGDMSVKLREKGTSLEFGLEIADLDRAGGLPGQIGPGRRVRARAWDLPPEWLDPGQLFGGDPGPALRPLAEVVRGIEVVEFEADLGTDRDVVALLAATAPFSKLGLEPIGAPVTGPSRIASMLPPRPAFALQVPWGKPKLLHQMIDENVDLSQVPAPFDTVVSDAVAALHAVLDQLREETIVAVYIDNKGRATLLMAGGVVNEEAARASVRTLLGAAEKAFKAHIALLGDEKDKRYTVAIKRDVKFGRAKADHFTVTVPKFLADDLAPLAMMVGKKNPKLDAFAVVDKGVAILAIGAGAKDLVSNVGKTLGRIRSASLEADGGLAQARAIDAGCQFCLTADPLMATRLFFVAKRDGGENDKAGPALKKLAKIRLDGQLAFAVTVTARRGSLGFAFPRKLVDGDPRASRMLNDLIGEVDGADASGEVWDGLAPGTTQ